MTISTAGQEDSHSTTVEGETTATRDRTSTDSPLAAWGPWLTNGTGSFTTRSTAPSTSRTASSTQVNAHNTSTAAGESATRTPNVSFTSQTLVTTIGDVPVTYTLSFPVPTKQSFNISHTSYGTGSSRASQSISSLTTSPPLWSNTTSNTQTSNLPIETSAPTNSSDISTTVTFRGTVNTTVTVPRSQLRTVTSSGEAATTTPSPLYPNSTTSYSQLTSPFTQSTVLITLGHTAPITIYPTTIAPNPTTHTATIVAYRCETVTISWLNGSRLATPTPANNCIYSACWGASGSTRASADASTSTTSTEDSTCIVSWTRFDIVQINSTPAVSVTTTASVTNTPGQLGTITPLVPISTSSGTTTQTSAADGTLESESGTESAPATYESTSDVNINAATGTSNVAASSTAYTTPTAYDGWFISSHGDHDTDTDGQNSPDADDTNNANGSDDDSDEENQHPSTTTALSLRARDKKHKHIKGRIF